MKIDRNAEPEKVYVGDVAHGTAVRVPSVNGINPDPIIGLVAKAVDSPGQKMVVDLASGRLCQFPCKTRVRVYPDAVVCLNQEGR